MGVVRNLAIAVLSISFITFVALFGRLPMFRKSPIGRLHRMLWIYIPGSLRALDVRITGGQSTRWLADTGNHLMNEKHPLVVIFFIALLSISQILFLPPAWPRFSLIHRILVPIVVVVPYLLLYAAVTSNSSIITRANHSENMQLYPYDYAIFHPGNVCRTCQFLKPARSKHCSICKACVARHDHHCIWLNNCVGRTTYSLFMALLLSLTVMLVYAVYLGHGMLDSALQAHMIRWSPSLAKSGKHWSSGNDWGVYIRLWTMAITDDARIGAVTLLSLLTAPIAFGLFAYHVYLVWAGMTTNESVKWADWRDEVADGNVYKAKRSQLVALGMMKDTPKVRWPVETDQVLTRTEDGQPPRFGIRCDEVVWSRVRTLQEIDNLYDLGFWDNVVDAFVC